MNYWLFLCSFLKNLFLWLLPPQLNLLCPWECSFSDSTDIFFLVTIKWCSVWKFSYSACSPGPSDCRDVDVGTSLPSVLPQCFLGYTAGTWLWNLLLSSCRAPPALQPCFVASPPLTASQNSPGSFMFSEHLFMHSGAQPACRICKEGYRSGRQRKSCSRKKMRQRMHQSHGGGNAWSESTEGPSLPQPHQHSSAPGMGSRTGRGHFINFTVKHRLRLWKAD